MPQSPKRRRVVRMLQKKGWYRAESTGGHDQYKHRDKPGKVTVPQHISRKVYRSILRQAGLA